MLTLTHLCGERIVALFPAIGSNGVADIVVVTYNERDRFTVAFALPNGHLRGAPARTFATFPAALRAARQSQGWG